MRKNSSKLKQPLLRLKACLRILEGVTSAYSTKEVQSHLTRFLTQDSIVNETAYIEKEKADLFFERLNKVLPSLEQNHPELLAFERSAQQKWVGPQGGSAPWEAQRQSVLDYVDTGWWSSAQHPLTKEERLELVDYVLGHHQGPITKLSVLKGDTLMATYKGVKKSCSGIYLWRDRRELAVRMRSFNAATTRPWDFDPVVTGQRLQRNKLRDIFMDTFPNLFRANRFIRPVHDMLLKTGIPSWEGHHVVEDVLYRFVGSDPFTTFEMDFDRMDIRETEDLTTLNWVDLLDVIPSTQEYRKGALRLIHKIYNIDVVTPEGLIKGKKHLLSGLPPTNDYESYDNIICQVGFLRWHTIQDIPLLHRDFKLFVLGDDVMIIFKGEHLYPPVTCTKTGRVFQSIQEAMAVWAELFGLTAKVSKQAVRYDAALYCKRYYARGLRHYKDPRGVVHPGSAYPLTLAANALFNPEQLNHPNWPEYQAIRWYQICDEVAAHPLWKAFVRLLVEMDLFPLLHPTDEALRTYRTEEKDWRFYLYGELYELAGSPTYAYLTEAGLLPDKTK